MKYLKTPAKSCGISENEFKCSVAVYVLALTSFENKNFAFFVLDVVFVFSEVFSSILQTLYKPECIKWKNSNLLNSIYGGGAKIFCRLTKMNLSSSSINYFFILPISPSLYPQSQI